MPELVISTTVCKSKVTPAVLLELSKIFASSIGKPEQYCTVRVMPDQLIVFGGSADPCVQASITSIGKLGVEENKALSASIFAAVERLFGVPSDRMYIAFTDKPSSELGYKGTTFHDLMGYYPPCLTPELVFASLCKDHSIINRHRVTSALALYGLPPPTNSTWFECLQDSDGGCSLPAFTEYLQEQLQDINPRHHRQVLFSLLTQSKEQQSLSVEGLHAVAHSAGVKDVTLQECADMVSCYDTAKTGSINADDIEEVLKYED